MNRIPQNSSKSNPFSKVLSESRNFSVDNAITAILAGKTRSLDKTPYRRLMLFLSVASLVKTEKKSDLSYPFLKRLISPCVLGLLPMIRRPKQRSKSPCLDRFPCRRLYVPQAGIIFLRRKKKRGRLTKYILQCVLRSVEYDNIVEIATQTGAPRLIYRPPPLCS